MLRNATAPTVAKMKYFVRLGFGSVSNGNGATVYRGASSSWSVEVSTSLVGKTISDWVGSVARFLMVTCVEGCTVTVTVVGTCFVVVTVDGGRVVVVTVVFEVVELM